MKNCITLLASGILLAANPSAAPGLGFETIGNRPISDQLYHEWPNLSPVINDTNRVYHYWVNGGEGFFFQGDTAALNEALKRFSKVQADVLEVVFLPGPVKESSLQRKQEFQYDWSVNINTGIARFRARGKGELIWCKDPVLTVFIGEGNIVLEQVCVPEGIVVLELSDLRDRYIEAVRESDDIHVRGWGAGRLALLDPFSVDGLRTVTSLLEDTNEWVRLNAAGALGAFGRKAVSSLPALRRAAETSNTHLKEAADKTMAAIEAATDNPAAEAQRHHLLQRISLFRKWFREERER